MSRTASYLAFLLLVIASTFSPALAEKRVALVIGNSAYAHAQSLDNPQNDARLMAAVLERRGFEVDLRIDLDYKAMKRAIRGFTSKLQKHGEDTAGLFFYAGHGLQSQGRNFLVPVDAEIEKEGDIEIETIGSQGLLSGMQHAGNRLNIVILDACRNNPYRGLFRSDTRGLARMDAPVGSMVAFSTSPGTVAADGAGNNSPYAAALAKAMEVPGLKIEDVFKQVRQTVYASTKGRQVPWESTSIFGDFFFTEPLPQEAAKPDESVIEQTYWRAIANARTTAPFEAYLEQYPEGQFADEARKKIAAIAQAEEAQARARAEAEAKARAEAVARAQAEMQARAEAEARAKAEAAAKAEAEQRAKAMAEARKRVEQAIQERDAAEARVKAEAQARAAAEEKARNEADARSKTLAQAEARAKAAAEARARTDAEAKQLAEAIARADAAEAARKQAEAEAQALAQAKAKLEAEARASREAEAKRQAQATARAEAAAKKTAEAAQKKPAQDEQDEQDKELAYWTSIKDWSNAEALETYLERYPKGRFVQLAQIALDQIKGRKEVKVAALDTSAATDSKALDPRELTLALQRELKRVGCDPGAIDGKWGGKGRAAVARFNKYASLSLNAAVPTPGAIDAIKEKKSRVCPAPAKRAPAQAVRKKPVPKKKTVTARTPTVKKKKPRACHNPASNAAQMGRC